MGGGQLTPLTRHYGVSVVLFIAPSFQLEHLQLWIRAQEREVVDWSRVSDSRVKAEDVRAHYQRGAEVGSDAADVEKEGTRFQPATQTFPGVYKSQCDSKPWFMRSQLIRSSDIVTYLKDWLWVMLSWCFLCVIFFAFLTFLYEF